MRGLTFRVGDIPVRVDPSFWIIMGLFGLQRAAFNGGLDWVLAVEWVALVFIGILIHELGHAFAFRKFGKKPEVTLYAMGGLTSAAGRLTPARRLATTLAGPGVGMLLGAVVFLAVQQGLWEPSTSLQRQIYRDLLFINIGWGVLNLVPLYPLDGGQSLEALLGVLRVKAAEQITSYVSIAMAAAGGWWAATNGQIFILLIAFFLGLQNVRRLRALRNPPPVQPDAAGGTAGPIDPQLQRTIGLVDDALRQGRTDEAVEMLEQEYRLRPGTMSGQAYAAVLARTQRFDALEQLAMADHERLGAAGLATAGAALVAGGRFPSALRAAEAGWNADPDGHWQHAVTAAAARAGMRDVEGAIGWLYMAISRGWTDRRRLESDPLFADVRGDPRMGDIVARMGV